MLEIILNRWRGTGVIYGKITGNMIYAGYWFLLVAFLSEWYFGLIFAGLYVAGESYSWGKWVSYICFPENHEKEYDNKTGRNFPWIHYIANFFVDQEKDYLVYCRLALSIRGLFWFLPMLAFLYFIDLIVLWQLIFGTVILSLGFPVAADLRASSTEVSTVNSQWNPNREFKTCVTYDPSTYRQVPPPLAGRSLIFSFGVAWKNRWTCSSVSPLSPLIRL